MEREVFITKLPKKLKKQTDKICALLGLKKSSLVEEAIREKLEDLLDAHDLKQAMDETTSFRSWKSIKKQLSR